MPAGYVPLTDPAPLIAAQELGVAAEQWLTLELHRAPSWPSLRDMLAFGKVDTAKILAPVPIAAALGLGSVSAPLSALPVLPVNGTVIGVSSSLGRGTALAKAMQVLRSDLYRNALLGTSAGLPGAPLTLEGAISALLLAAGESAAVSLLQNRFFDGRVFDPQAAD
ncbi:ABC transporter substrate-binding protein [Leisingera sp. M527]|uniref:ABC transporter substrate-binding protein n=1 Tax=Leisingera sp. M527 TaxID=2867014 RepID=UPI0038FD38F6